VDRLLGFRDLPAPAAGCDPALASTADSPRQLRVVIAGSVRLYRDGLAYALGLQSGIHVGVATDYESLVERAAEADTDIVLLDVSPPGTAARIDALRKAAPRTKIVAFAMEDSDETVLEYVEAGVVAFVPRDCAIPQLIATLESAARGETIWSPRRTALLCHRLAELASVARTPPRNRAGLTSRERQIVEFIELGMSNKQIASKLGRRPTEADQVTSPRRPKGGIYGEERERRQQPSERTR
jgi:DNA-binding NarL/FixJ family response regulator